MAFLHILSLFLSLSPPYVSATRPKSPCSGMTSIPQALDKASWPPIYLSDDCFEDNGQDAKFKIFLRGLADTQTLSTLLTTWAGDDKLHNDTVAW